MKKTKGNTQILEEAAQSLKLETKKVQSGPHKNVLYISDGRRFYLAHAGEPGFYPRNMRWNAHFSRSKLLTQEILHSLGYHVITSEEIRPQDFATKKELFTHLTNTNYRFPVLLKPDRGLRGQGIAMIDTLAALKKAARKHYSEGSDIMIQPILNENEYRILVINDEVVLMHSKQKPFVTGDGKRTIAQLLAEIPKSKKDATFIALQYKRHQARPSTVLKDGERFEYHLTKKPTADFYATTKFPRATKRWAEKLAKDINAPVVGIDVFIPDDFSDTDTYTIIELNSNPGVDYLATYCDDPETPERIFKNVLIDYFEIKK